MMSLFTWPLDQGFCPNLYVLPTSTFPFLCYPCISFILSGTTVVEPIPCKLWVRPAYLCAPIIALLLYCVSSFAVQCLHYLSFFLLYYLHNILSMYFFSLSLSYFLWELCNESETFFAVTRRNHFQVKCEKSVDSIFSSSHRLNKSFPYLHTFLSKTTFTHSPSKLLLSHCSSLSPFLSCKLSMYPFLSFFHLRNLPIIL